MPSRVARVGHIDRGVSEVGADCEYQEDDPVEDEPQGIDRRW
jgi:hypothetical protein